MSAAEGGSLGVPAALPALETAAMGIKSKSQIPNIGSGMDWLQK